MRRVFRRRTEVRERERARRLNRVALSGDFTPDEDRYAPDRVLGATVSRNPSTASTITSSPASTPGAQ
jgi:hypothetical protein